MKEQRTRVQKTKRTAPDLKDGDCQAACDEIEL